MFYGEMNRLLQRIGVGVIAVLVGYSLASYVPGTVTANPTLAIVNRSLVQFGLLSVLVYGTLSAVVGAARSAGTDDPGSAFSTISARTEPDYVETEWEVRQFGVDWTVLHGKKRGRDGLYAYAVGPLCPECGTELRARRETRRLRSDRELWNCHGCSFRRERPSEYLGKEKDVVETFVDEEYRQSTRDEETKGWQRQPDVAATNGPFVEKSR